MLRTAQRPMLADNHLLNLHDLLSQLTVRLAWTLVAAGSLGIWFTFIQRDFAAGIVLVVSWAGGYRAMCTGIGALEACRCTSYAGVGTYLRVSHRLAVD